MKFVRYYPSPDPTENRVNIPMKKVHTSPRQYVGKNWNSGYPVGVLLYKGLLPWKAYKASSEHVYSILCSKRWWMLIAQNQ